jgi:hypothetical protein
MSVLLAVLPYVASIGLYGFTAKDVVSSGEGEAPSNWNWKLVVPVVVGALTPLALAASDGLSGTERGALLSVTGVAIVFGIGAMTLMRDESAFFGLQQPVFVGKAKLTNIPRWKLLVGTGAIVLCYGAVVNVIVAGNADGDAAASPVSSGAHQKQ